MKSTTSDTIFLASTLKGKIRQLNVSGACKLSKTMHVYEATYKSGAGKHVRKIFAHKIANHRKAFMKAKFRRLKVGDISYKLNIIFFPSFFRYT